MVRKARKYMRKKEVDVPTAKARSQLAGSKSMLIICVLDSLVGVTPSRGGNSRAEG